MDIKRKRDTKIKHKYLISLMVGVSLILLTFWGLSQPNKSTQIESKNLWFDTIKQGDLQREAKGFGILEAKTQKYLTAQFSAVISEIRLKPGAKVSPNSIILTMTNPEIDQAVITANLAVNAEQSVLKQLELTQNREKLDIEIRASELSIDLKVARSRLQAEKKLAVKGIVSQLDLMKTKALVEKLINRERNIQNKLKQLRRFHLQAKKIQIEKIEEKRSLLKLANNKKESLNVRAGLNGVLQALPVKLGQSVANGNQLALVGGTNELIAIVQVPQADVQNIQINMPVEIDTRGGTAKGKVMRIDPVVVEGKIEIEIALLGELPDNARPALNIEATILLKTLKNVLYFKAPVNSKPSSSIQLYKLDNQNNKADLIWLKLGKQSGQFIEVISGANVNDRFILSDMRKFKKQAQLTLIN
ncbi:hypothetical protein CJF42_14335 [Pseudoalteromonas sp. NBT06-2]|uniref:efflux RND transporter periplasmic adaptor subunit n=1 Tax=Pseudoalteromonas sp. NBT06-2 TaxID=2025950 RepID=UPI000BA6FA09|nr:HlyD family efflux transporter periplasmic adaptor subunit [Pseudoalteromonas sp. NBT06-2]PAJ73740.1 hypothetical protein CJF42_14335 [Pseudoalteromonas sp. NBT06-2]